MELCRALWALYLNKKIPSPWLPGMLAKPSLTFGKEIERPVEERRWTMEYHKTWCESLEKCDEWCAFDEGGVGVWESQGLEMGDELTHTLVRYLLIQICPEYEGVALSAAEVSQLIVGFASKLEN